MKPILARLAVLLAGLLFTALGGRGIPEPSPGLEEVGSWLGHALVLARFLRTAVVRPWLRARAAAAERSRAEPRSDAPEDR